MLGFSVAAALFAVKAIRHRRHAHGDAARVDALIEVESDDSFPASDPPSHTPTTGATILPPGIH